MKTKNTPSLRRGALALFVLFPLASMAADTTDAAKDPSSAPQTHVLFTGADISILYNGKVYPVEDVDGTSLAISVKDQAKGVDIPRDYKNKKLVVNRVQTLTDRSATVTNFKHERAYTPANDPARKASEAIQTAIAMADNARMLEAKIAREPAKVQVFRGGMAPVTEDNSLRAQMEQQLQMVQSSFSGPLGIAGQAGKMAEEAAAENFDALETEFALSSPSPIKNAYAVVIAEYHTKENPKDSQLWLAARSVGLIDSTPRKFWSREGGLPPGYILENVHLHVYEQGREIATDISENRAALTRDEAHEYLVLDHMNTHKTDTMPVQLVLTKLPADWNSHPRDESFNKIYYVKVDKTGHPAGVFEDQACTTATVNSYCETVLRNQLFLPALNEGTPIDSIARIKLSKLQM